MCDPDEILKWSIPARGGGGNSEFCFENWIFLKLNIKKAINIRFWVKKVNGIF